MEMEAIRRRMERLPEALRPDAEALAEMVLTRGLAAMDEWFALAEKGDWEGAYRLYVAGLSTEQLVAEQARLNAAMAAANAQQRAGEAAMRRAVIGLLIAGARLGAAELLE